LQQARENADAVGQLGEEYVNAYLTLLKGRGEITDFDWISAENAIAPYDFQVDLIGSQEIDIDVKSTAGEFTRIIHISMGELRAMSDSARRYDLYRIFGANERHAKLRIYENIEEFVMPIMGLFGNLPGGVTSDGISVSPSVLNFGEVIQLDYPEDREEE
jgi:hypothetical protein